MPEENEAYDVFICHATEDKDDVVRVLVHRLKFTHGLKVFYDELSLDIGDSLREKINEGLAKTDYGVVILSPNFFRKRWPQEELNGLTAREVSEGRKMILPVWHKVDRPTVEAFSPILADKIAVNTSSGIDMVAQTIAARIKVTGDVESRFRTVLRNQRFDLVSVAGHHGRIEDTWFLNSTLRGPAVLRIGDGLEWISVVFKSTQFWVVDPNRPYEGAIPIRNSRIEACDFYNVGLAVTRQQYQQFLSGMPQIQE